MDKKQLLSPNLARIMVEYQSQINQLWHQYPSAPPSLKQDGSPVTSLDLALSTLLEQVSQVHFPQTTVYSEENFSDWNFPLMAIDPLDGTREYIQGRPEWAVSIGHLESENFEGQGWVYNPVTLELFTSDQKDFSFTSKQQYQGEVSHSEWNKGLYSEFKSSKFLLNPKGSIAYKLGRLSAGKIDFVVSLAPKNIWDIAGGTLLCAQQGMKFYSEGKVVTKVQKLYSPPLIWCHEELYPELSALFEHKGKGL